MSRNLHLTSRNNGSVYLYQTPSEVTNQIMALYESGKVTQAIEAYREFLKNRMKLEEDEINTRIREIETFIAFIPDARFYGY